MTDPATSRLALAIRGAEPSGRSGEFVAALTPAGRGPGRPRVVKAP